MRNFEAAVDDLIGQIEPEGYEFNETARSLATIALHDVELRYGESSDNSLPQHNAEHALDVAGRAIELTNLVYEFIPEKYRENIYELALLVGVAHDWEQLLDSGNEQASANYLIGLIEKTDDEEINNEWFKARAENGVMATEFEINDDGIINQFNLGRGKPEEGEEPDPLEFIVAFADINGIAMEGESRMSEDVAGLYIERCQKKAEQPSEEGLREFIDYQPTFIKSQLDDEHMKPIIAYYFSHLEPKDESKENPVYEALKNKYNPNIRKSYKKAWKLRNTPELLKGFGEVVHRADVLGISDKLGGIIDRIKTD
jgi:hypothetical protein